MLLLWNHNPEVQLGSACDCERLVDNCVTVTLKQANRAEPSRTGPIPDTRTRTRTSWTGERRLQWLGRFSFLRFGFRPFGPPRLFAAEQSRVRLLDSGASCCRTPLFRCLFSSGSGSSSYCSSSSSCYCCCSSTSFSSCSSSSVCSPHALALLKDSCILLMTSRHRLPPGPAHHWSDWEAPSTCSCCCSRLVHLDLG